MHGKGVVFLRCARHGLPDLARSAAHGGVISASLAVVQTVVRGVPRHIAMRGGQQQ